MQEQLQAQARGEYPLVILMILSPVYDIWDMLCFSHPHSRRGQGQSVSLVSHQAIRSACCACWCDQSDSGVVRAHMAACTHSEKKDGFLLNAIESTILQVLLPAKVRPHCCQSYFVGQAGPS